MTICFVILHYLAYQDTVECISSIRELYSDYSYRIVVVDNGSWNQTGGQLKREFGNDRDIDILCLKENLGFARGNNEGYIYAKKTYSPDFIIIVNNDVVFTQREFLDKLQALYEEEHFSVLGPDILDRSRTVHTSPIASSLRTIPMYRQSIYKLEVSVRAMERGGIWGLWICVLERISSFRQLLWKLQKKTPKKENKKKYQCVLQGACFIFSPLFIEAHALAFCPDTFLYHEEHILLYQMLREGGKIVYSPDMWLVHKEDCATNMEKQAESKEKKIFKFKEEIKSQKILLRMMEEDAKHLG